MIVGGNISLVIDVRSSFKNYDEYNPILQHPDLWIVMFGSTVDFNICFFMETGNFHRPYS
jgi:hypothetical protein